MIGCDKKPDKVVLDAFEDIHSSSVYYVVQGEESKIINALGFSDRSVTF